MRVLALVNEGSGTVQQTGLAQICDEVSSPFVNAGHQIDLFHGAVPDLLARLQRALSSSTPDLVVSVGGDGTIAAIANLLQGSDVALFPAPAGTMNMLATDLGYHQQIDIAAEQAQRGHRYKADIATLNGDVFMNNVVIGTFAEIADKREELRDTDGILDGLSVATSMTQTLLDASPEYFDITADGKRLTAKTNTLMVSNNLYSGAVGLAPHRQQINEGVLGFYQFQSSSGGDFLSLIAQTIIGNIESMDQVTLTPCKNCTINFNGKTIAYSVDGEPKETREPLAFSIQQGGLVLWKPER